VPAALGLTPGSCAADDVEETAGGTAAVFPAFLLAVPCAKAAPALAARRNVAAVAIRLRCIDRSPN
jgi:hypothetical protein